MAKKGAKIILALLLSRDTWVETWN